jgi:hypothetical protein
MKNLLFFLLFSTAIFGQNKIDNYKYIIVPNSLEFFNEVDKYQTSSLTKFLFNKYGFVAFMDNERFPSELASNRCLALKAHLKEDSGMFNTVIIISLLDCNNNVVYTSSEGKSKFKEYKRAYHDAIRKAFNSIRALNYKYNGTKGNSNVTVSVERQQKIERKVMPNVEKKSDIVPVNFDFSAVTTSNGFILKSQDGIIKHEILATSNPSIYIIRDSQGVLFKTASNAWKISQYKEGKLVEQTVRIKF